MHIWTSSNCCFSTHCNPMVQLSEVGARVGTFCFYKIGVWLHVGAFLLHLACTLTLPTFCPVTTHSIRQTIETICETWPNLQKRHQRGKHQKSKAKTSCKIVMDILSNQLWVIDCALIYWKTIRSTIDVTSNLTHQQKHAFWPPPNPLFQIFAPTPIPKQCSD